EQTFAAENKRGQKQQERGKRQVGDLPICNFPVRDVFRRPAFGWHALTQGRAWQLQRGILRARGSGPRCCVPRLSPRPSLTRSGRATRDGTKGGRRLFLFPVEPFQGSRARGGT